MSVGKPVVVVDPDPAWPQLFATLRDTLAPVLADVASTIEHVGSTAVPGLPAKPVIDLDVVVASPALASAALRRLETLGYQPVGDLGVPGREACRRPHGSVPHHLYVCVQGAVPLRNPLTLRDHMRAHPEVAAAYGALKRRLARAFPNEIDGYIEGKTAFILEILAQ